MLRASRLLQGAVAILGGCSMGWTQLLPLRQGRFGVLIHLPASGGTAFTLQHGNPEVWSVLRGKMVLLQEKEVSCGQRLHPHAGERESNENKEHHEQLSSSCPLRRLLIVNSKEREKHIQRSVGLQREQWALGWKLKGSRELNQMSVPSLCWKRFWELCSSLLF